jgi:carbonic anhydrase
MVTSTSSAARHEHDDDRQAGRTGTPKEKEKGSKGHEHHRRGAERERNHRRRLRSPPWGPPAPKIAIVTCADPRLTSIEQMLGLAASDVDMIRNFGTVIDDDAVRSHPWISPEVPIRGFVYDVSTGRLSEVFPDGETVTS